MKYILKVWLYGGLASDYLQPLSNITVRLLSCSNEIAENQYTASCATDSPHPIKEKETWSKLLLAKGTTNSIGKIDLLLNDSYDGGAFDAGILVTKPNLGKDNYVYLKTLTPFWHRHGNVFIGAWNYCLLPRSANKCEQCGISLAIDHPMELSLTRAGKKIRTSVPTPGLE